MKNRKIDRLNLSDEHKVEVRALRNRRRNLRKRNRVWSVGDKKRYHELLANGRR